MKTIGLLALLLGAGLAEQAQQPQQPRFSTAVEMVRFEVDVMNDRGAILGLSARDFEVTDNGRRQDVSVDELVDTPLDLAVVVQPLASIAQIAPGQLAMMSQAMTAFEKLVEERDRVSLTVASAPPRRVRPLEAGPVRFDETARQGRIDAAVFDAMVVALSSIAEGTPGRRRALLAFTNGADFRSTTSFDRLTALARRLGPAFALVGAPVPIREDMHAVAGDRAGRRHSDVAIATVSGTVFPISLRSLAKDSGGVAVNLGDGDPKALMEHTLRRLRTRYEISFLLPPGKGWHEVAVKVNRRGATVTARPGYWVD